jgi:RHS repeat-associated protein
MKTIRYLIYGLLMISGICRAQDGTDPSWTENTNALAPSVAGGAQPLFQAQSFPLIQSGSAVAEAITPDIQTLANNLGDDPTRIFNYVHDQIQYVHYFGSKKGAELTLLERSGNDFDQCALLSALLQAAGYSPTYQFAMQMMPYDNPTNHQDLHHWLGLSLQNTNWNNTLTLFSYLAGTRGFPVWYTFPPDTNTIAIQRIWVNLSIGGTNYYLDPSFKVSEPVSGINLTSAMALNTGTLYSGAGGSDTGYSVSGLSETSVRNNLQTCNSNLLGYISNNIPNATIAQVIGGQQIVPSTGLSLSTSLDFPLFTNSTYPLLNWTYEPTNFMGTFSISFAGTNITWLTPQLEGQRLSLTFSSNGVAQIWLEDSNVLQISNTSTSNTVAVAFSATHPYGGGWNSTLQAPIDAGPSAGFDKSSTNAYQCTNASYAVMYGFEPNQYWLQERQRKLNAYLSEGLPNTSRQVTTETLNVMGLGWMVQTALAQDLLCQEWNQLPENQHRFGRMAQEAGKGYYVDVYLQLTGTLPATGGNTSDFNNEYQVFDVSSYLASAMEHGIIQQLQDSNLVAASTVKMLDIANSNSQPVYLASSANWTSGANIRNSLVNYGSSLSTLDGLIGSGYILLLPQNGSNHVAGATSWAGDGYVELGTSANGRSMGMIIGGGYHGGYVSDPTATINPPYVEESDVNQPTFFDPQPVTLQTGPQLGADPVNLVDGSLQISTTALTSGGTEPRGYNLTQYYSSARLNSNPAGMGPGWLNSYYCNALPISDPEGGLGTETVQQMAPMIVATYAALNLYTNTGTLDAKNWMVTTFIAKWGIDQLINNAVSVNLGNNTVQFVKRPDGSYTPPPNCTMTLTQTNGAFVLQERHGRTFKFNANNVLTNITDQYAQFMTLAYNSNNLVTNVVDWKGRHLAFTYTNGVLTSVADDSGRSVSYGHTGGNLTSYTDPEHKTTTYLYDTNNELVATYDALNRLVETNFYDGAGHIITQLTEGSTNKTWQVQAAGYQTVETDPVGDQRVLTYDSQSRPIADQDGLGNVTQTFYDGQDHIVMTISPLGETNQYFYDGNNNLVEMIDSLGYTNQFYYDSQNRLYLSLDGRGNATTCGYNAQFSITGQTNGAGDWVNYSYTTSGANAGTLASRTDPGGTTTFGYDSYGQLNSITYPNGLGSESFVNDEYGDVKTHTDGRGFLTTFSYNNRLELTNTVAPTNLTTSVYYDPADNVTNRTDARGNAISYTWSATRKLLTTTLPTIAAGTPVSTGVYDNRDWLAENFDPLNDPTLFTNNPAQWLVSQTDPLKRTVTFNYDNDGRKTMTINASNETNSQTWDANSDLIALTDGAQGTSLRAYDGAGNQIILTNRNGKIWQFQFDAANRLTNTIPPSPMQPTSQTFNHQGLLATVTDPAHQATYFYYDGKGRLTNSTDNTGTTLYGFDANDNRVSVSENGLTNVWTYDAYNRVSTYKDVYGNLIQYRWDANGDLTNLVYPGGKNVFYTFDNDNHLTQVKDWAGRVTTLSYDLAGRLTTVTRPNGTFRTLSYDSAGELTNIWEQMANGLPIAWLRHNWNPNATMNWEFAAPLPHTNSLPTRTMAYHADNELATVDGLNVTEDNDGNLTYGPLTNDDFVNFTFDARNRLLNVGGVTNIYDAMNNRIGQTYGTNSVIYVVNPNAKLSQVLMSINDGVTNYYVYGAGLLYQVTETPAGEKTLTHHYDYRGSTIALTADSGLVVDRFEYSLYGTMTYHAGMDETPFLFNGRFGVISDPNGLLYMRARYHNPYICRFISADPSGFGGGLNWYAYVDGNPASAEDPLGLQIPTPVTAVYGWQNMGQWGSDAQYNQQVQAANEQATVLEVSALGGYTVGAVGATAFGVGATALVSAGVPQSVVTGGLFVTGVGGVAASGYSIYNNPSPNNIAFNAGGLAGGLAVGEFLANNVASALSPSNYQPSGPASLASELSMVWTDSSGNPNPLSMLPAWLLPGAGVGPMSTGPSIGGAAGAIAGGGSGATGGFSLWAGQSSSSSTGK